MRSVEVAKTVLEVADVALTAVEHTHYRRPNNHPVTAGDNCPSDQDLESLRSENRRLRNLLDQNLKLLHNLSESPCVLDNCPPDLNDRLVATLKSDEYLTRLKLLQQETASGGNQFPFKEATEFDYQSADILVNVDSQEPSWWVWVTDETDPSNVEEWGGIDDENYLVIGQEHVVDGVANFMARCILSNPKALNMSPEELQKATLGDVKVNCRNLVLTSAHEEQIVEVKGDPFLSKALFSPKALREVSTVEAASIR